MEKEQIARDEDVLDISKHLIEQNQQAYEDLAGKCSLSTCSENVQT